MRQMSTIPEVLDWVAVRAGCTVEAIFNNLCDEIEVDVATVNSIRELSERYRFKAEMMSGGTTIVVAQPMLVPRARAFIGIAQGKIHVRQDWIGGENWSVSVGLNDAGKCTLRLEDQTEIERWQFRRRALERLFFDDAISTST